MKYSIITLLTSLIALSTFAQNSDPVLMTVDGNNVTKSEFEQIFWKNKKENTTSKTELDEYMVLFKKFKLKVAAAEEQGIDTTAKFKNELAGYKSQLERPYLVDTTLNEALINEAYYRIQNEVKASHILIKVKKGATPKDTLKAYNRILKLREQILAKKMTFSEAAQKNSEDPSAKQNSGNLGYFSAFRMVYPFENAAYNNKIGQISMPFRTQFGYHILSTDDLRKGRGKIKVAHIMIRVKEDLSEVEKENLKKKTEEIYQKVKNGEDFETLAKEYSEDRNSARKGGELAWINTGETFTEFDDAAFGLDKNGDISTPVKTPVGWHIIKRIDYKPVGTLDEMRSELKHKIQRDVRSQKTRDQFINNLKKEYGFIENKALLTNFLNKEYKADKETQLFSFANKTYSMYDFTMYLVKSKKTDNLTMTEIEDVYNRYTSNELIEFEKTQLNRKYPAFKALLKEYRDGILLFDITDQKVWSKAVKDTSGLKSFYESHKQDYVWANRIEGKIFSSSNKKTAKKAYKLAKKGKIANDSIANYLNKDSQLNIKLETGVFETETHEYLKNSDWKTGLNKVKSFDGKYVFVVLDKKLPSAPKKLNESKGLITAAYQEYLETEWLNQLESKFKIEVNKEVLYSITKK